MFRSIVGSHRTCVLAAVLASTAAAALPAKGATYKGTLYAERHACAHQRRFEIKVAASGKSARVISGRAEPAEPPSTIQFAIKPDGTFRAFSNTGSLTVWSFIGRFVSKQKARAVPAPELRPATARAARSTSCERRRPSMGYAFVQDVPATWATYREIAADRGGLTPRGW